MVMPLLRALSPRGLLVETPAVTALVDPPAGAAALVERLHHVVLSPRRGEDPATVRELQRRHPEAVIWGTSGRRLRHLTAAGVALAGGLRLRAPIGHRGAWAITVELPGRAPLWYLGRWPLRGAALARWQRRLVAAGAALVVPVAAPVPPAGLVEAASGLQRGVGAVPWPPRRRALVETRPVAVTGATGFVGAHLLAALGRAGLPARALRRPSSPPLVAREGLRWVQGTLADPAALAELVDGCQAVIHAAAVGTARRDRAYWSVNVAGTAALLDAASGVEGLRFVHLSSVAAARPRRGPYAASKAAAEQLVRGWQGEWRILRPPLLWGPGSQVEATLSLLASLPVIPALGRRARVFPVHVADLAEATVAAARGGGPRRCLLELPGPEGLPFAELAERLTARWGGARPVVSPPDAVARQVAAAAGLVLAPVGLRAELVAGALDEQVQGSEGWSALGLSPRAPGRTPQEPGSSDEIR